MSIETLSTSEDPSMRAMLLELMLWDGIMWFALLPVFYRASTLFGRAFVHLTRRTMNLHLTSLRGSDD